jgi:hypothetical protein
MGQIIYDYSEAAVMLVFTAAIITPWIMNMFGAGDHPYLSAFFGGACGIGLLFLMPLQPYLVVALTVLLVIGADVAIAKLWESDTSDGLQEKLVDKLDVKADSFFEKWDASDEQKMLHDPNKNVRMKKVIRDFREKGYYFTISVVNNYSADDVVDAIGKSKLEDTVSSLDIVTEKNEYGSYTVIITIPHGEYSILLSMESDYSTLKVYASYLDTDGLAGHEAQMRIRRYCSGLDELYMIIRNDLTIRDVDYSVKLGERE